MISSDWDDCFLLHHRPHGETSLIVDVFTKKNGKMSVIAKGAKKPKSKFFGYLAPFTKLKITYSGRSELKTLTNIDRDFSQHLVFRHYIGFTYTAPSSPSCPHAMNQVRRGVRRQLIDKGIRS